MYKFALILSKPLAISKEYIGLINLALDILAKMHFEFIGSALLYLLIIL